jgi:hypothetical protein
MLLSVDSSIQLVHKGVIGRGGPIFWSPRSPDLIPVDFLLWDTSRILCTVKRFGISGSYEIVTQQPSQH